MLNEDYLKLKSEMDDLIKASIKTLKDYLKLKSEMDELIKASIKTLKDNYHLCDGNNCTLYDLKKSIEKICPEWDQ